MLGDHTVAACYTFRALGDECRRGQEYTVELSIGEAKARFATAAHGERVVVTNYGRPFIELVSAQTMPGMDFENAAMIRRELGLDGVKVSLPTDIDDPAFSRRVLGVEP